MAWRKAIKPRETVRHIADWDRLGEFVGPSKHPEYDVDVDWLEDGGGVWPSYIDNLYPEWWPIPDDATCVEPVKITEEDMGEVIEGVARGVCGICGDDILSKQGMTYGDFKIAVDTFLKEHKNTCRIEGEQMFGYPCPECGKGTIGQQTVANYKTKIHGEDAVIPQATIGVCDQCGTKNFDAKEWKRWVKLTEQKVSE